MPLSRFGKWQLFFLGCVTVVKAVVMTITPLSLDLSFLISQISHPSKWAATPYGELMSLTLAAWYAIPGDHPNLAASWTGDFFRGSTSLYLLVFMLKLPLLILDLAIGIVLYRIVLKSSSDVKKGRLALFLWFLNPYVFLVGEMWWSIDLLPTFLLVLAFALRAFKRTFRAAALYAAATALKLFPIMLLPIFLIRGAPRQVRLLFVASGILGVAIYFAWVLHAGYDPSVQLRQYDMFTQYFDEEIVSAAGGARIGLATVALIPTYALLMEGWTRDGDSMLGAGLLVFLAYFAFGKWYPQFLIWLIPFIILDCVKDRRKLFYLAILLLSALAISLVAFHGYFTANGKAFFFIPAANSLGRLAAAFERFANDDLVVLIGEPLARGLFVFTCIIYFIDIVERQTNVISRFFELKTRSKF